MCIAARRTQSGLLLGARFALMLAEIKRLFEVMEKHLKLSKAEA